MELKQYIRNLPWGEHNKFLDRLAAAHGVTRAAVKHWITGRCKHPATLASVKITEEQTHKAVRRWDIRPDVYQHPPANPKKKRAQAKPHAA